MDVSNKYETFKKIHVQVSGHYIAKFIVKVLELANFLNTSYLTDSYISFTLKWESWQKICSNMLIRSSTYGKKNISDFHPCGKMVVFVTEFVIFLKTSK